MAVHVEVEHFHSGMEKSVAAAVAETEEKEKDRLAQQNSTADCYYYLKTCRQEQERCAEKPQG